MVNDNFHFNPSRRAEIGALLHSTATTFSDLARIGGIAVGVDFVGADLKGCDFSGSDLRGYNFTKADLRDGVGSCVHVDETTCFEGALVEGSIFFIEANFRQAAGADKSIEKDLRRFRNEFWSTGSLNLMEYRKENRNFNVLCQKLYTLVQDQTYQANILHMLAGTFEGPQDYRNFLLDALQKARTSRSRRAILDILLRRFPEDATLFAAVASMINAPDEEIAIPAARSVLYSRFRKKNKRELRNIMQHEKRNSVRKAYLESVATSLGRDYMKLVKAPSGEVLDFQTKLTDELIRNVIAVINREIDRHFRAKNLFFDQVGWSDVQEAQ
ncbi:pentapeptide repeat-containing protein [Jiella pelagia]|uniref:Pentapeptide repeat-containing protein n=1 Tax=Jiella pelagia TaxID=2986949 RepID=A0ABY7C8I0_9HYPH|nr:pentapeptide repeat-containing protein [Jiella pelagia]WAP70085.1 pentapeptide repeat-containing protein [Jiella pelagia]